MKIQFHVGQLVHYKTPFATENGVVKSLHPDRIDAVFVVYKCGGDWENFRNYTAALTNTADLRDGWPKETL